MLTVSENSVIKAEKKNKEEKNMKTDVEMTDQHTRSFSAALAAGETTVAQ